MEINNSVRAGYMPPRSGRGRAKNAGEEDFLAKMLDAVNKEEEEKNQLKENPLQTTEEMMRFIRERKQEIYKKVQKGETEVKIRIGAQEYTQKEWKKLMESFDETEDDIRKQLREAREQQRKARAARAEVGDGGCAENVTKDDENETLIEKLLTDKGKEKAII